MSPNPAILTWPYVAPAGGGGLSISFAGTVSNPDSVSRYYTIPNVPIGTADATRTVVFALATRGTSVNHRYLRIGTSSGTDATRDAFLNNGSHAISIWHAPLTEGATVDVWTDVVTASDYWMGIGAWSITGAPVSVATSSVPTAPVASPVSMPILVQSGDIVVGAVSSDTPGVGWANLTERYEEGITLAYPNRVMSGADATVGANGTLAVTAEWPSEAAAAIVSYRADAAT